MFKKLHPEAGARPGTLILGHDSQPFRLRVTRVDDGACRSYTCNSLAEVQRIKPTESLVWIDVRGFGDGTILQELSRRFGITPLAMEDLVNAPQRPKSELFAQQQLIIAHSLVIGDDNTASLGQLGIVFGKNYVLTFHQKCDDVLEPIHRRLENVHARLRSKGPDYLVYAILDSCVDGCYPFLGQLGDRIESLEQRALRQPRPEILAQIHAVKNMLAQIRRSVWPQREMVLSLLTNESPFIKEGTREYIQDTADHCAQLSDAVDMYRESTSGLINTYMSVVAHRSNEIMKVLTLLSSVFVPPTFLAGVYGMNFVGMRELELPFAYPIALSIMLAMIAGTLYFFYRRGWLSWAPIDVDSSGSGGSESPTPAVVKFVLETDIEAVEKRVA